VGQPRRSIAAVRLQSAHGFEPTEWFFPTKISVARRANICQRVFVFRPLFMLVRSDFEVQSSIM